MPSTVFRLFSDINARHNHELLAKKCKSFFRKKLSSEYFLQLCGRLNKNVVIRDEVLWVVERVLLDLNFPPNTSSRSEEIFMLRL